MGKFFFELWDEFLVVVGFRFFELRLVLIIYLITSTHIQFLFKLFNRLFQNIFHWNTLIFLDFNNSFLKKFQFLETDFGLNPLYLSPVIEDFSLLISEFIVGFC